MLLRTQYLRAGGPSGGGPPGYNASAAAGARQFCGLPGGGPFGGNAFGRRCPSAAAVPSAVMTLRAGERFRSEKLVGTEKAVIFAPRTSGRCPARQGGRQRGASGDGRRSATTGQQSAAVGSGIMQQTVLAVLERKRRRQPAATAAVTEGGNRRGVAQSG